MGLRMWCSTSEGLEKTPSLPNSRPILWEIQDPHPPRKHDSFFLKGEVPAPINPPAGCRFHTRCPEAVAECSQIDPDLREVAPGHKVACIRVPGWAEAKTSA